MALGLGHLVLYSVGLALSVLSALVLLKLLRRDPVSSYRLLVAVLFAAVLLPTAQLILEGRGGTLGLGAPGPLRDLQARLGAVLGGEGRAELAAEGTSESGLRSEPLQSGALPPSETAATAELLAFLDAHSEQAGQADARPDSVEGAVPAAFAPETREAPQAVGVGATRTARTLARALTALVALYLAGFALAAWRTAGRLLSTHRLLARARALPADESDVQPADVDDALILAEWRRVASGTRFQRGVRILRSPELRSPACWDLRRPVLVLPEGSATTERPGVLRFVLMHELVHLERRDTWISLLQELLVAALWFHPGAWWLSRRMNALRELSCDELVVRRTGGRRSYAAALVDYAASALAPAPGPVSPLISWSRSESQLQRRIQMLVSTRSRSRRPSKPAFALASCLFSVLWGGQLALAACLAPAAQEPAPEPSPFEPTAVAQPVAVPAAPSAPVAAGANGGSGGVAGAFGSGGGGSMPAADPSPSGSGFGQPWPASQPWPGTAPWPATPPAPAGSPSAPTAFFGTTPAAGWPAVFAGALPSRGDQHVGIYLGAADEALAAQLDTSPDELIVITNVAQGSPAERAGLERYDVIVRVGDGPATQTAFFAARDAVAKGEVLELVIARRGKELHVAFDDLTWDESARARNAAPAPGFPGFFGQSRAAAPRDEAAWERMLEAAGQYDANSKRAYQEWLAERNRAEVLDTLRTREAEMEARQLALQRKLEESAATRQLAVAPEYEHALRNAKEAAQAAELLNRRDVEASARREALQRALDEQAELADRLRVERETLLEALRQAEAARGAAGGAVGAAGAAGRVNAQPRSAEALRELAEQLIEQGVEWPAPNQGGWTPEIWLRYRPDAGAPGAAPRPMPAPEPMPAPDTSAPFWQHFAPEVEQSVAPLPEELETPESVVGLEAPCESPEPAELVEPMEPAEPMEPRAPEPAEPGSGLGARIRAELGQV